MFADVERFVELERVLFNERSDPDFNLTYVLVSCHQNRTIYEVRASHVFVINNYQK